MGNNIAICSNDYNGILLFKELDNEHHYRLEKFKEAGLK